MHFYDNLMKFHHKAAYEGINLPPLSLSVVDAKGAMQYVLGRKQPLQVELTKKTRVVPLYIGVTGEPYGCQMF